MSETKQFNVPRRTVLITGCSPGGIGNSLARCFHDAGFEVIATARSTGCLYELESLGISTLPLVVDSEESIQQCLSALKHMLGAQRGLDYLVHNAGRNYTVPALDIDMDEVRYTFATNVIGPMQITQLFAPLLIQAKGTIVMIGSVAAVTPMVFSSVYNASKAALKTYADTLRIEMEPFGVAVITIMTGGIQSRITRTVRNLAESSLYQPVAAEYRRRQIYSQEDAMPNEIFAKKVLSQVIQGGGPWPWRFVMSDARKRWAWIGAKVTRIWLVGGAWTWSGLFDYFWRTEFKLDRLRHAKRE